MSVKGAPGVTKPLPEPMFTYHQQDAGMAFIWGYCHKKICKIRLKFAFLKLQPVLPGTNMLGLQGSVRKQGLTEHNQCVYSPAWLQVGLSRLWDINTNFLMKPLKSAAAQLISPCFIIQSK